MNKIPYSMQNVPAIVDHYDEFGFAMLTGISPEIRNVFQQMLLEIADLSLEEIDGSDQNIQAKLTPEIRRRLARVSIDKEFRDLLFREFRPLLADLIGPLVHVSEAYHVQIKGKAETKYVLGGYFDDGKEVEAPYGFHQDFTGGRVTTSPSMVIFWFPLCTRPFGALQIYPRSHRRGLFCNQWLNPDNKGLSQLGKPIEIIPQEGEMLIFNALTLHASQIGPRRRISCDLRFFPFCGFLDSEPHVIVEDPLRHLETKISQSIGETIKAPLLEDLAYLGAQLPEATPAKHSVLNWPYYVQRLIEREASQAVQYLGRMVNEELGFEKREAFLKKYEGDHLVSKPYAALLSQLPRPTQNRCRQILKEHGLS